MIRNPLLLAVVVAIAGCATSSPRATQAPPTTRPGVTRLAPSALQTAGAAMVAWWPGEGDARDFVGGHDALITAGGPGGLAGDGRGFASDGRLGRAFAFNAQYELVDCGSVAALAPDVGFSAMLWYRAKPGPYLKVLLYDWSQEGGWEVALDDHGAPNFALGEGWGATEVLDKQWKQLQSPRAADEKWRHVVVTYDGKTMALYEDGQLTAAAAWDRYARPRAPLWIGGVRANLLYRLDARINDVALFKRALSAQEVAALYQSCQLTPGQRALSAPELEELWAGLEGTQPELAWEAVARISGTGEAGVALVRARLLKVPAAVEAKALQGWIVKLNDDRWPTREWATQQLIAHGSAAKTLLLAARDREDLPAESRFRIERILETVAAPGPTDLPSARIALALQRNATPAARSLLEELAQGKGGPALANAARAALDRK